MQTQRALQESSMLDNSWVASAMLLIPAAFMLDGCATRPVGADGAKLGTANSNPWQQQLPDTGEFVVTRGSGLMDGACSEEIYVDSHEIATLRSGHLPQLRFRHVADSCAVLFPY